MTTKSFNLLTYAELLRQLEFAEDQARCVDEDNKPEEAAKWRNAVVEIEAELVRRET
jgi:hypothetical protein